MPRIERQRAEISEALRSGDVERALALAREHLAEFPGDADVRRILVDHATDADPGPPPAPESPRRSDQSG